MHQYNIILKSIHVVFFSIIILSSVSSKVEHSVDNRKKKDRSLH